MERPSGMITKKKTSQGRKKIEIKKIEGVNNRQVTFSKRRAGLFKKASELCILSGAEVAIIVRSSSGRVFSFGHQSVDTVLDKFVNGGGALSVSSSSSTVRDCISTSLVMSDLNAQYAEFAKELEGEKKRSVAIEEAKSTGVNGNLGFWWDEPMEGTGMEELERKMMALEELRNKVEIRADEMRMIKGSNMLGMSNGGLDLSHDHVIMNQTHEEAGSFNGFDLGGGHF